jgi:hypothetical protein
MWMKQEKICGGGLTRKRRCDIINEGGCEVILEWWETTTTISPI